ncbi:hypothetical protein MHB59_12225 [Bacillus sp. FSL L8-0642]|uniref:hypothetical protein n=1 Tax=Bacillus TaxID=1386 RepID=UPI0007DB4AD3|nr:hypothetical protein [Bacillus wiedmannii]OAK38962.1 hypothetical protein A6286_06530 [Bacillus wiedmannii]
MTLIAGIVLPKGILIVSDTRQSDDKTDEIIHDYSRKITLVAPDCILGTSGSESSFYTAKILRNCLYNSHEAISTKDRRNHILDFYNSVNDFSSKTNKIKNYPVGCAILADYDKENESFTLTSVKNFVNQNYSLTFNKARDVDLIGASESIQDTAKVKIQAVLQSLTEEQLSHPNAYRDIAEKCQTIFQQAAKEYVGISDKLYVFYLTTLHNKPASDCFLLEEDGTLHDVDRQQDGEIISYTK